MIISRIITAVLPLPGAHNPLPMYPDSVQVHCTHKHSYLLSNCNFVNCPSTMTSVIIHSPPFALTTVTENSGTEPGTHDIPLPHQSQAIASQSYAAASKGSLGILCRRTHDIF